jgi:hypothetical protein
VKGDITYVGIGAAASAIAFVVVVAAQRSRWERLREWAPAVMLVTMLVAPITALVAGGPDAALLLKLGFIGALAASMPLMLGAFGIEALVQRREAKPKRNGGRRLGSWGALGPRSVSCWHSIRPGSLSAGRGGTRYTRPATTCPRLR